MSGLTREQIAEWLNQAHDTRTLFKSESVTPVMTTFARLAYAAGMREAIDVICEDESIPASVHRRIAAAAAEIEKGDTLKQVDEAELRAWFNKWLRANCFQAPPDYCNTLAWEALLARAHAVALRGEGGE